MAAQQLPFLPPQQAVPILASQPPIEEEDLSRNGRRIVAEFRALQEGQECVETCADHGPWLIFQLENNDYDQIMQFLDDHYEEIGAFVSQHVQFDYNPRLKRAVLRHSFNNLHAGFTERFTTAVSDRLSAIAQRPDYAGNIASRIECYGRDAIGLSIPGHDIAVAAPDTQFGLDHAFFPGVVFEISYPWISPAVHARARQYVRSGTGQIRVAVVFDIRYTPVESRRASFTVYRPFQTPGGWGSMRVVDDQPFRDESGQPVPNGDLNIELRDFSFDSFPMPNSWYLSFGQTAVRILSTDLADALDQAEEEQWGLVPSGSEEESENDG
ncbi:hypothetical protein IQ07DRAFT_640663 [Pyrenochaeta sp. DS3sAY3a]|nr:hypothetical protein IQ07DRAFT_640663 [Pyrenochaeta sp. DS3sAY3a]